MYLSRQFLRELLKRQWSVNLRLGLRRFQAHLKVKFLILKLQLVKQAFDTHDACDGSQCAPKENYGHLTVVDALYSRVFTIYFANTEGNNRGIFYALPNTVKYLKNERGYKAQYKAIYWGDDPRSNQPFKDFVSDPGIELACTQENKL